MGKGFITLHKINDRNELMLGILNGYLKTYQEANTNTTYTHIDNCI